MSAAVFHRLSSIRRQSNCRQIFSINGVWPETIDKEVRHAVEKRWMKECSESTGQMFLTSSDADGAGCTRDGSCVSDCKYVLSMFPYPSGNLHMGHVRVYSIGDTLARFYRLQGYKVLQPIGWDSFGLPAENAAIERNMSAAVWTRQNVTQMTRQLRRLCLSFDWQCEMSTSDPSYYRWTQWLFVQLYRARLAYQKHALVNWDPVDATVLADEQVDSQGRSWRSGAVVERRLLRQWFIRTTRYAERLRRSLDGVDVMGWRDVPLLQRHWLGDCEGFKIDLQVTDGEDCRLSNDLTVWLPDLRLLRRTDCLLVRSNHPILHSLFSSHTLSEVFSPAALETAQRLRVSIPCGPDAASYRQVPLVVYDPPVGECDELVYPKGMSAAVWSCGTSGDNLSATAADVTQMCQHRIGVTPRCQHDFETDFNNVTSDQQLSVLLDAYKCSSHLHDWLVSRQRYWGTPIPVVHCRICGTVPVPECQLPVLLPEEVPTVDIHRDFEKKPRKIDLTQHSSWINTNCPRCGGSGTRETDTLDTFVDSSWYYLRYLDVKNTQMPFDADLVQRALPVSLYVGGKEHATLHLYYARFMHHFLHTSGLVNSMEPFDRLLTQGQVMGRTYRRVDTGQCVSADQVDLSCEKAVLKDTATEVRACWEKMSKSKFNGVDPSRLLDEFGSDTTRLFVLSTVAPTSERRWSEETFPVQLAWQQRLWLLVGEFILASKSSSNEENESELTRLNGELRKTRNYIVRSASFCLQENYGISVAITRLQTFTKQLRRVSAVYYPVSGEFQRSVGELIIMLSPVMPCLTAEMWTAFVHSANRNICNFNWTAGVHQQSWPQVDMDGLVFFRVQVGSCIEELPIERRQMEQLTVESALQLVKQLCSTEQLRAAADHTVDNAISDYSEWKLNISTGLGAVLRKCTENIEAASCNMRNESNGEVLHQAARFSKDRKSRKYMKNKQRKKEHQDQSQDRSV